MQLRIWKQRRTDSYDAAWKEVLLCQKLFLERKIIYVEISEFEIITRTCRVFKARTTF